MESIKAAGGEQVMPIQPGSLPEGRRLNHLQGIKVVDMTRALAGPFGGMILSDLGADVIKVEPLTGDPTRGHPPYSHGGDGGYFLTNNRNKRSIAVNLREPEAREIVLGLVKDADVLLDNLRGPQRSALGLEFSQLEKVNPQIVSCSITGFGSDGPYADRPAYDIVVEALAGVMSLTGPSAGPSVRSGVPIGDLVAGLYAVIGTLSGLEHRRAHGKGTHIDIGMLDCQVSLLSYLAQYYLLSGFVAGHQGTGHVDNPMYDSFVTKDGREIVTNAGYDDAFEALCKVIGRPEVSTDPRFVHRKERLANREALQEIIRAEVRNWDIEELYQALLEAEVPAAPIHALDEALDDPQVRHRNMVVQVPHRVGEPFVSVGSPVKSEDSPGEPYFSPPAIGGDTGDLLAGLGYGEQAIRDLAERGVIRLG